MVANTAPQGVSQAVTKAAGQAQVDAAGIINLLHDLPSALGTVVTAFLKTSKDAEALSKSIKEQRATAAAMAREEAAAHAEVQTTLDAELKAAKKRADGYESVAKQKQERDRIAAMSYTQLSQVLKTTTTDIAAATTKRIQIEAAAIAASKELAKADQTLRDLTSYGSKASNTDRMEAALARDKILERSNELEKEHIANQEHLATLGDKKIALDKRQTAAQEGLIGGLKKLTGGIGLAAAAAQLYAEAGKAKTTGNYSGVGGFIGGQLSALGMGISSKTYNEVNAQTRGAMLTTSGQSEMDKYLDRGASTLTPFSENREEAMKTTAELHAGASASGIGAKTAGDMVDKLGVEFGQLSKITGKTAVELAKMSMAIATDVDHREQMIGLGEQEKAQYLEKMMADRKELVLQGYSLEQAEALQKLAAQKQRESIQDRVGKTAKASAAANIVAQIVGGDRGAKITKNATELQQIENARNSGKKFSASELADFDKRKVELQQAQLLELREAKSTGRFTGLEASQLESQIAKYEQETGASAANANQRKDIIKSGTQEAKLNEDHQGQGALQKTLDFFADNGKALMANTLAITALTAVMALQSMGGIGGIADKFKAGARMAKRGKIQAIRLSRTAGAALPGSMGSNTLGARAMRLGTTGVGKVASNFSAGSGALKALGAVGTLATAGFAAADYMRVDSDKNLSADQKTEKKGGILGGVAGGLGAGAIGAMIGTAILPGIGTIAGGMLGSYLGSSGGEALGKKLGSGTVNDPLGKKLGSGTVNDPKTASPAAKAATIAQTTAATTAIAAEAKAAEVKKAEAAKVADATLVEKAKQTLADLERKYYEEGLKFFANADPETFMQFIAKAQLKNQFAR